MNRGDGQPNTHLNSPLRPDPPPSCPPSLPHPFFQSSLFHLSSNPFPFLLLLDDVWPRSVQPRSEAPTSALTSLHTPDHSHSPDHPPTTLTTLPPPHQALPYGRRRTLSHTSGCAPHPSPPSKWKRNRERAAGAEKVSITGPTPPITTEDSRAGNGGRNRRAPDDETKNKPNT